MASVVRAVFKKLVTNQYMADFDYINTQFTFKTVYNVSKYTYRCCPCGFEHEYLDYIGNDGEINKDMYEKVVNSIVAGMCPHVNDVNEEDTAETGIYGIAIALVLGTETISDKTYQVTDKCYSGLFNVDPFMLAIKRNFTLLPVSVIEYCRSSNKHILDMQRSKENVSEISLEKRDVLELLISNKKEDLLQGMPIQGKVSGTALRSAFECRRESMINAVMQKIELTNHRTEWTSHACCRLSIIYDQPEILQTHLGRFSSTFHIVRKDLEHMLNTHCMMLERPRCKAVVSKFNKYEEKLVPLSELVVEKLMLLLEFYDDISIRDEILSSLKHLKEEKNSCLKKEDFLKIYSRRLDYHKLFNITAFKTIFDIGDELYSLPQNDISHLETLLGKRFSMGPGYRQIMEILLFENPDFEGNEPLFKKSLEVDNSLENTSFGSGYGLHMSLVMDSKVHAMFKHDGKRDFALNFTGPLLIECGCPYSFNHYYEFLGRFGERALQPAENEYMCQIKDSQKTLAIMCRDVLRHHFKGPQIHSFVKQCNIPQKIRDFILLKNVLKCIPADTVYY